MMKYEFKFDFEKADINYVHENMENYNIIEWIKENSEDTMEIVKTDKGFIFNTIGFNSFNYYINSDNSMTLEFKFVTGVIESWDVPAVFSNISISRYCQSIWEE